MYAKPELGLTHLYSGKVRETYLAGAGNILIVTTDRISAYDHIVGEIPGRGKILNEMTEFWLEKLASIVPNHLTGVAPEDVVSADLAYLVIGRSVVAKNLNPIRFEAVVRGYLVGSGWTDYQETGAVCGIKLPEGLRLAEKLPEPIFTPATKGENGEHDENVTFDVVADVIGNELAAQIRDVSIKLYKAAQEYAESVGIIIADTKFEFGIDDDGELVLMDEVLTPDSSRFWPAEQYEVGSNPPSFDKQYLRDYLVSVGWDGKSDAPPPELPPGVVELIAAKYREARNLLCYELRL